MSNNNQGIIISGTNVPPSGNYFYGCGTIAMPLSTIPFYPEYKCEICKEKIRDKFMQLEVHVPQRTSNNKYQWVQSWDKVKNFYFHPSCFYNNLDKLKKLIILSEITDE